MATEDGFPLDNATRTHHQGLRCVGAINPASNITRKRSCVYDMIAIGAGYAGLTACRDLCTAGECSFPRRKAETITLLLEGLNVLLLEARDRIGRRTYTTEVDGHLYEIGGTWIH